MSQDLASFYTQVEGGKGSMEGEIFPFYRMWRHK